MKTPSTVRLKPVSKNAIANIRKTLLSGKPAINVPTSKIVTLAILELERTIRENERNGTRIVARCIYEGNLK